jgi:hypothetical protein
MIDIDKKQAAAIPFLRLDATASLTIVGLKNRQANVTQNA